VMRIKSHPSATMSLKRMLHDAHPWLSTNYRLHIILPISPFACQQDHPQVLKSALADSLVISASYPLCSTCGLDKAVGLSSTVMAECDPYASSLQAASCSSTVLARFPLILEALISAWPELWSSGKDNTLTGSSLEGKTRGGESRSGPNHGEESSSAHVFSRQINSTDFISVVSSA